MNKNNIKSDFSYMEFIGKYLQGYEQDSNVSKTDTYIKWLDGEEINEDELQYEIYDLTRKEVIERFIETETQIFREALTAFMRKREESEF